MTPLGRRLAERIARFGPLTVADYMAAALTDPEAGYYMSGDPFGASGDFTTAPEVSQMFGELIGLWCADLWQRLGRPNPVWLVELGPGRGTLMADALRAGRAQPGFLDAIRLALVDVSPALRARQAETLARVGWAVADEKRANGKQETRPPHPAAAKARPEASPSLRNPLPRGGEGSSEAAASPQHPPPSRGRVGEGGDRRSTQESSATAPLWLDHLGELPNGPLLLVANEFFDALPIRQFERTEAGWRERRVGLSEDGERLAWTLGPSSPALTALVPEPLRGGEPGTVAEVAPAGLSLAAWLGARLAAEGGAALVIDYGAEQPSGRPTLQAVRRHAAQNVLAEPGAADLTAHVDFAALAEAATAAGAEAHGPVPQGAFLKALGIETRAAALARGATPEQERAIAAALERLTADSEMGTHFKALALAQPDLDSLPGFA